MLRRLRVIRDHIVGMFRFMKESRDWANAVVAGYSFCESATSSGLGQWHIRRLTDEGRKLGGGIDTPGLCGWPRAHDGWDLAVALTEHHLTKNTCSACLSAYREET